MNVNGKHYRTIWLDSKDDGIVKIIDQRCLPHKFVIEDVTSLNQMAVAIEDMHLRGAGLIGAAAAWGMYLGARARWNLSAGAETLKQTRPTAVNLAWAVDQQLQALCGVDKVKWYDSVIDITRRLAQKITDEDAEMCKRIGEHGVSLIESLAEDKPKGEPVNILTHCNAGWLAFVDYGSATSPIYAAHDKGIPLHVYVDETRPRNQGARLTAWELGQHGVPHTVIADNVGGHLMQHGLVDMVITGADRVTRCGDVANKIGTYLKALAACDNNVPFYVALPSSTFDWEMRDGVKEIPIEERGGEEVRYIQGLLNGKLEKVLLTPQDSPAVNYGFDVTPHRLITGLVTPNGICSATEEGILELYPGKR